MTKAAQILSLYDGNRSTREIAEIVGCHDAYVRVVARQRKGTSESEIDRRYLQSTLGQEMTRKRLARTVHKRAAYYRTRYSTGDKAVANDAAKKAYREARNNGAHWKEAKLIAFGVRAHVLFSTGNASAARQAFTEAPNGEVPT